MASPRPAQVAIRSDYVRRRTAEISRTTGMTVTRIIEEALAHYAPPVPIPDELPPGLVREGRLLVLTGGGRVTVEQVNASIEETRNGVRD